MDGFDSAGAKEVQLPGAADAESVPELDFFLVRFLLERLQLFGVEMEADETEDAPQKTGAQQHQGTTTIILCLQLYSVSCRTIGEMFATPPLPPPPSLISL
jgi:hypothetical protein